MKEKVLNKLIAIVLTILMMFSYIGLYANVSTALENDKTVTDWRARVFAYCSGFSYGMNEYDPNHVSVIVGAKNLFYDATREYENLTCIRTGAAHDSDYKEVDLYKLEQLDPDSYNYLFKEDSTLPGTPAERYNHILWEIEHFYLFSDLDTNDDKQRRLNEFNTFIGANENEIPYPLTETVTNQTHATGTNSNGTISQGPTFESTKTEQLIKTLQNEFLMLFVDQIYDRKSDLTKLYEFNSDTFNSTLLTTEQQAYVDKIVNKFTNMELSKAEPNIAQNHNEYGNEKLTIEATSTGSDVTNNISGNFTVTNPYPNKLTVTNVTIKINGTEKQKEDYTVLDSTGNPVANLEQQLSNNNEYNFRVRADGLGSNTVEAIIDYDYGDVIQAVLLVPQNSAKTAYGVTDGTCQYLININKYHKTDKAESSVTATPKYFDLALTKQVTQIIPADDEDDFEAVYKRLKNISTKALSNGGTDAEYYMDKSLVRVENGCTVIYKINVYNEGQVAGFAEKVTDYLPEGLELPENSEINNTYGWHADPSDSTGRTVVTNYLSSNNNENSTNILLPFNGEGFYENEEQNPTNKGNMAQLELELKVNVSNDRIDDVLDNRAEITEYGYYADTDGNGTKEYVSATTQGKDRDSKANSDLADAHVTDIVSLIEKIEGIILEVANKETYINKNVISYEDDDDIERLVIKKSIRYMDLALRKWIDEVDGEELEQDRTPSQTEEFEEPTANLAQNCLMQGTLPYDNPKTAIELIPGTLVKYKIGIYNEGFKNAYANEITDYLPQGLEFVTGNEINSRYGWKVDRTLEDGTTVVTTDILSEANGLGKDKNQYEYENSNLIIAPLKAYTHSLVAGNTTLVPSYKIIEIVCKVSENAQNNKYLTNRAEITEYGYYEGTTFVKCNENGIDKDSREDTIFRNGLRLDIWYKNWLDTIDVGTPPATVPGEEDDDDFETVVVKINNGDYTVKIKKVTEDDEQLTIKGAIFKIKDVSSSEEKTSDPTGRDGITTVLNKVVIDKEGKDEYIITEDSVPEPYTKYKGEIQLEVAKKIVDGSYVIDEQNTKVTGKNVKLNITDNLITITVPNPEKEFDLSLRKFITSINDSKLEGDDSREPVVTLDTLINGDPKKNGEKTATYTHTKDPVYVNPKDIVEYTLRVYNEGELAGYANRIIDDVPAGVTMVAPKYDESGKPLNKNAEYRWAMYREMTEEDVTAFNKGEMEIDSEINKYTTAKTVIRYNEKFYVITNNAEEAVIISTDYLSMENGENMKEEGTTINPNLISAFNGTNLDSRDIKVEFEVKPTKDKDTIITNHAQISENYGIGGISVTDRDSNPNEWNEGEDDQDVEHLHVNWFDLALYKWVSTTIVTEDGVTKEYKSGHTQDNKDAVVNVTIAKDKLNKTVVKFKWMIKVENQSPIPGYATEIKDHIPAGLKFIEADNKDYGWKQAEDGTITTDYLKETLLHKGETAEVPVILTWVNGENNLGVKVNYAEISEDFNAYGAPDIDSTPNNFTGKPVEDDEDLDEVRLNVRTGTADITSYVIISMGFLAIVSLGAILVKINVLDKEF